MKLPPWLVVLIAVAAVAIIYNVAKSNHVGETCAVTALGQKLCGNELRAWCDATDSIRQLAPDNPTVADSQRNCDTLR